MRTLPLLFSCLMAALLVNLTCAEPLHAESGNDRYAIHKKYQTSPDGRHGMDGLRPEHPVYEKQRWRDKDQLGKRLAWREYQGHMQKHYRIMERYGGYSPAAAYRSGYGYSYGPGYGLKHGHDKNHRRGHTPYRAGY